MSEQADLDWDVENTARARRTDPETSHAAAASIPVRKITEAHHYLHALFQIYGAMSDTEAWNRYQYARGSDNDVPRMSPSGFRTRRSELVARGLLRDSGVRHTLASGRLSIRWEAA